MQSIEKIKDIFFIGLYLVYISVCTIVVDKIYAKYERAPFKYIPIKLVLQKWRPTAYKSSDIPGLIYEMLPSLNKKDKDGFLLKTNSVGIRAREYEIPKPKNTFIILILGDSVAYGLELTEDLVFSALLERMLNNKKDKIKYEVINASVPGYNTMQEYIAFVNKYYIYQPDLVLVGFCHNDLSPAFIQWVGYNGIINKELECKINYSEDSVANLNLHEILSISMPNLLHLPFSMHRKLILNSSIYRTLAINMYNFLSRKDPNRYPAEGYLSIIKEQFEYAIKHLKTYCQDNNIDLVFVLFPVLSGNYVNPELDAPIIEAKNMLNNNSIGYVDLKPYYQADVNLLSDLALHKNDKCHFNALGHKLTAEIIYKFLEGYEKNKTSYK